MSNLGPLTTTFTPIGSGCSSIYEGSIGSGGNRWLQYGTLGDALSACLPPNHNGQLGHFYSPGLCPSGYAPACTAWTTASTNTAWEVETTCCPRGYSCINERASNDPFGCMSYAGDIRTFDLSLYIFATDSTGSITGIDSEKSTRTVFTSGTAYAYPVVVRTATSSNAATTTNSETDGTSIHYSTVTVTATGHAESGENNDGHTGQGLSSGIAAAIGVTSALSGVLLLGIVVFLVRRYQRRRTDLQAQGHYASELGYTAAPQYQQKPPAHMIYPGPPAHHQAIPQELSTENPSELSAPGFYRN